MAWPSGTKASTANVDQGADKIALARPDIKQNIDNVNAIIDTFDIASPSEGDLLAYDATAGQWKPTKAVGFNIIQQDNDYQAPSAGSNPEEDYSSTFTVSGGGGITTSTNTITFPAGTYVFQSLKTQIYGFTSFSDNLTIRFRTNDSAEDLILTDQFQTTGAVSGPTTFKALLGFGELVTFASDTTLKLTFQLNDQGTTPSTYSIAPIRVERIA